MGEPTVTRQDLRRKICLAAQMPFYKSYSDYSLVFSSGGDTNTPDNSTTTWFCTKLVQTDGYWNEAYAYVISTDSNRDGVTRKIGNFNRDQNAIYLEYPCDTDEIPTSDDSFEIMEMWAPHEIHQAINDVLLDSWRWYPEILTDESLVVQEDIREYDVSTLNSSRTPADILKVFVEENTTKQTGQMTTVTDSDTFGDTAMDLSMVNLSTASASDYRVGFYAGTGRGQLFELTSADTTTQLFTVATPATTNPDTTTKYTIWNQNEQTNSWYPVTPVRFDRSEYPDWMYIQGEPRNSLGLRWRIQYVPQTVTLSADSDTTTIPEYYIVNKALAMLHDWMAEDNRADRRAHMELAETKDRLARDYAMRQPRRWPAGTIWSEGEIGGVDWQENPLDW